MHANIKPSSVMTNDKEHMVDKINEKLVELYDELILPQGSRDDLSYMGEYNKEILHIHDSDSDRFLKEDWNHLWKMMSAVSQKIIKVEFSDMAVLNLNSHSHLNTEDVIRKMNPKICLIWGVNRIGSLDRYKKYEVFELNGGKVAIVEPILKYQEREAKIKVWEVMKSLFQ
jgi:hypothetical protein